jgi:hypothetical protein
LVKGFNVTVRPFTLVVKLGVGRGSIFVDVEAVTSPVVLLAVQLTA